MSSPQTQTTSDLQAVADALRSNDRFLLVTHENPDGDALGSLLATKLALEQLGKDAVMYLYGDAPLPKEYGFMELERDRARAAARRRASACSSRSTARTRAASARTRRSSSTRRSTLDIDHHHDNTRFGDVEPRRRPTPRRRGRCCATSSPSSASS